MYVNLGMRKLGHIRVREEPRVEARRQGISTYDCGTFEGARNQSPGRTRQSMLQWQDFHVPFLPRRVPCP